MPADFLYGLLGLSFWGYVLAAFIMVQVTMMAVTLYLHRDAAHRAVDLHPVLRHFFRLWIWMTSGMLTREWVAVHRKHHAMCEKPGDPHSPVVFGLQRVLTEGAELYREETNNPATLEKYGRGTPDDWVERKIYSRFPWAGIVLMVLLDLLLFGVPGIIIIAVQMAAMPVFAAGVINGLGHHTGYRNFESDDASTNLVPWGLLIGGEELHNNHHAFPSSAKFSMRPWEFDIGWAFLRVFQAVGLAKVRRVAPRPKVKPAPGRTVDIDTLRAVIVNRMHVLREYTRHVTLPVFRMELRQGSNALLRRARSLLVRQPELLDAPARAQLAEVLDHRPTLATVVEYRERLRALWNGAAQSNEKLLAQLADWVYEAEHSGIKSLQDFAARVRGYALTPQANAPA
ncbi:MAG: fatty acid desaturase [Gammaproteobacteria bacterium]|nr:fatty acid desaturase [Gammaproteobacteria bacterium]TVQ49780.1 MAG: acyl-CoA desaturase [Gammaproteobacteria bacterium]